RRHALAACRGARLEAWLGEVDAARAAAARPRALGPAARVRRLDEAGAADRGHVRRRARVVRLRAGVAVVARRDEERDARVGEVRLERRRVGALGTAPAIADDVRTEARGAIVADVEAVALIVIGLDKVQLAVRARGAGEVEVERGLDRP